LLEGIKHRAKDLEVGISQSQGILTELQVKFARNEAQTEIECQELERIKGQTQSTFNDAQDLLTQLTKLMDVHLT
jgi:uncharacterized SAM-dependent methyltransferase